MSIRNANVRPMGSDILFQISAAGDVFSRLNTDAKAAGINIVSASRPNLAFRTSAQNIPASLQALDAHLGGATVTGHQSDNVSESFTSLVDAAQFVAKGLKPSSP